MLEQAENRDENTPDIRNNLERLLLDIWQDVLQSQVSLHDNFFAAGGNSIKAAMIMNRLQQHTNSIFHPVSIFDAPSIAELTSYLNKNYAHVFQADGEQTNPAALPQAPKLSEAQIEQARASLSRRLSAQMVNPDERGEKNRQAIFILSPPRSGSTLLRVILGGHPQLFSPPELYLLSFNTMKERKEALSGRMGFLKEGLVRAIMEIKSCQPEEAEQMIAVFEEEEMSTKALFHLLQSWLEPALTLPKGDQIFVDKSPPYAFNPAVLERMEAEFEDALYIHLTRHPVGTIHSFEQSRVDLGTSDDHDEFPFSPRQKGELWWLISHQNILAFLDRIPSARQHRVQFEELVKEPQATVKRLCNALGLDFDPAMLNPYAEKKQRMTDGVHHLSRILGDPKFHTHQGITASVAERWREAYKEDFLCAETWAVTEALGYMREDVTGEEQTDEEREVWEF